MPAYSDNDLIRARRPLTDTSERGDAFCTLGHLEVEQRESPTADRAWIIREITANIAAFDGGSTTAVPVLPAPPPAPSPQPSSASPNLLVDSMRARHPNAAAGQQPQRIDLLGASSHDRMQAGMAASRASMERTLRRQGLWSDVRQQTTASAASASLDRELRRAGLLPPLGG